MKVVNLANHRPKESTVTVLDRYSIGNMNLIVDAATQFHLLYDFARRVSTSSSEENTDRTEAVDICRLLNLLTHLHGGIVFPFTMAPAIAVRRDKTSNLLSVYAMYIEFAETQRIVANGLPYTDAKAFLTVTAGYIEAPFDAQRGDFATPEKEPVLNASLVEQHNTIAPLTLYRRMVQMCQDNRGRLVHAGDTLVVTLPFSDARSIVLSLQSEMFVSE